MELVESLRLCHKEISKLHEVNWVTREEILKDFTHAEQAVIASVPAASNVEDLTMKSRGLATSPSR